MRFTICVLHVPDMDRALAFYRDTLGLPVRYAFDEYVEFDLSPATLALHHAQPEQATRHAGLFLVVEDVDALDARLRVQGLVPQQPLANQDFGYRTVMYTDPFGNRLEFATPLAEAA